VYVHRFSNDEIADLFEQVADLLATQHANPYRVRAYREAAHRIRAMQTAIVDLLAEKGLEGLEDLPGIGKSLASTLQELIHGGRFPLLDRLLGEVSPEDLFTTVPGIGEELAHRVHRELHIETLEELELAAHDGRLDNVKGFGARRARMVRDSLASLLSCAARRRARLVREREDTATQQPASPSVSVLLALDARYRKLARAGKLRTIAPRRFNPEGKAWLPVMHEDENGWSFAAMFSNTARAHELGKTRSWVVIYYEHDGHEGQCTVVTETRGPLAGKRVVRGREPECARHYESG
jgi:hypothetical protein